jgi:Zn-dependent oligopeptidase
MNNPLFSPYSATDGTIPFEKIKTEHFLPAIEKAIEMAREDIEAIKSNQEAPSFENTIVPYEKSGSLLGQISGIFFNLNSAHTSDEIQMLAQKIAPMLTAYSNEVQMDTALYSRIHQVYENKASFGLDAESEYLLDKIHRGFVRSGANLSDSDKELLKAINTELSQSSLKFGENLLKDSNTFELWIDSEADLKGLPESAKEAAKAMATGKDQPNKWLVTLDYPSYLPFMKYAENRDLRKELFLAFGRRGFNQNDFNNETLLKRIAELRLEKAKLLGHHTYADFVLEERMAKAPKQVIALWEELLEVAIPKAKEEIKEVQDLANELDGVETIERWDFSYYSEKLRDQKFALNDELLKPYFKLENVIDGAFKTATKLFGIRFKERNDIDKYHSEVKTFEVLNEKDEHLAFLYADFFPRPSKRNGAWMTSYRGQFNNVDEHQRPIISIVCNFTKPTPSKPSLLTFNEVTTLFHEFGHALHGILANGKYESLSGTSVFWDFVELPSQLMENWCYEPECLNLFAFHYENGSVIPQELVQKIKDSMNFLSAYQTVRQVSLGQLDMSWHNTSESPVDVDVYNFEKESNARTNLFPEVESTAISPAFSHIFSGGYAAGYYSYKWAEVLEADAFSYFKENGVFDSKTAMKYKTFILEKGGSEDPMELYKQFRGQAPETKALLKKSGLL